MLFSKRRRSSDVASAKPGTGKGVLLAGTLRGHVKVSPVSTGPFACTRVCAHTCTFCLHTPEVVVIYCAWGRAAIPCDSRD